MNTSIFRNGCSRCFNLKWRVFHSLKQGKLKRNEFDSTTKIEGHCYKNLFPWKNSSEFYEHIISSVVYNKDGLIALNKPFGIKVHGHDKPGTRYKDGQRYFIPSIPDCDYTLEDALPALKDHLQISDLSILKSAERYTSGIVILSSSENVTKNVKRSFNIAKLQKKPHIIHWMLTLGYPVISFCTEKVGIRFVDFENEKERLVEIVTKFSKRACKLKRVYSVHVEYRLLSLNQDLATSLVEIATSSVKWHFVRVYASSRIAPILGDNMYGSRMKTMLGIPLKVQLQQSSAYDIQPLPEQMSKKLNLPKGNKGHEMMPTMLHLRSMILPLFRGEDLVITAEPPEHFQWTSNRLQLLPEIK